MVRVRDLDERERALPDALAPGSAAPCSVTTQCTSPRLVTIPAPSSTTGWMRLTAPSFAVDRSAMIGLPPGSSPPRG